MTADQRLDQLEPLLSEAMTVLDRHTVQLRQLSERVVQIVGLVVKQSDNISFLLSENIAIKDRLTGVENRLMGVESQLKGVENRLTGVEEQLTGVEGRLTGVEGQLTGVEEQLTGVENRLTMVEGRLEHLDGNVNQIAQGQTELNRKLDLILQKLP